MSLLNFLAPPSCVFCATPSIGEEGSICTGCFGELPWKSPAAYPLPGILEKAVAMLHYSFPIDIAIKAFKFDRKLFYGPAFAEILLKGLDEVPEDVDAVEAVPLHWRRKAARGFNQAEEIAKPVARSLGVPLVRVVRRIEATPFQSGLDAEERARNLCSAFVASRAVTYKHVLIIDDVVTTGATTKALAKALLKAGVSKVSVLAVARAG